MKRKKIIIISVALLATLLIIVQFLTRNYDNSPKEQFIKTSFELLEKEMDSLHKEIKIRDTRIQSLQDSLIKMKGLEISPEDTVNIPTGR